MNMRKLLFGAGVALSAMMVIYLMNPSAFMSMETMLKTGYFKDPDYPGEIRGHDCGDCDNGVIRFGDSVRLIDIMSNAESEAREEAGFAFRYLQRHLLRQFADYVDDETTDDAIKMLKHLLSKSPNEENLSVVYFNLYKTPDEMLNRFDLKKEKIFEARSLFSSFCSRRWGEKLTLEKSPNEELFLVSKSPLKNTPTAASWVLHVNTITRRNNNRELEVIPRHCFKDKGLVYELLDYERSLERAIYLQNKSLATELVNVRPELLDELKGNPDKYRNVIRWSHSEDRRLTSYDWLAKWLRSESSAERRSSKNLVKNFNFEQGDAHWRFSENSEWAYKIGSIQTAGIKISSKSNRVRHVSQCVPLDGHQYYVISAYVKSSYVRDDENSTFPGSDYTYLSWHDTPDCTGRSQGAEQLRPEPSGHWQYIEGFPRMPSPGAVAAMILLAQSHPGSTAYWDNVKLHGVDDQCLHGRADGINQTRCEP